MRQLVKIIGIARHRLSTDGDCVTTLVAFHGCPLRCRYCLNPQSLGDSGRFRAYSPDELYAETRIDELYFIAMNPAIYRSYTGHSNDLVHDNLRLIADAGRQHDCIVRIPLIPDYNTDTDREKSRKALEALGFTRFDLFTYQIRKH